MVDTRAGLLGECAERWAEGVFCVSISYYTVLFRVLIINNKVWWILK